MPIEATQILDKAATAPPADPAKTEAPKVETTKTEPPKDEAPKTEPAKPDISAARFALLAKKEKAVQEERAQVKAEKAAIEQQKKEVEQYLNLKKLAETDPVAAAKIIGLTYDKHTLAQIADSKPDPEKKIAKLESDLEAYKREQEEKARQWVEEQQQLAVERQEQLIKDWEDGVIEWVKTQGEEYEFVKLYGAERTVVSLIQLHHKRTGKILSNEEAAKMVEQHLIDDLAKGVATPKFKTVSAKATSQPKETSKRPNGQTQQTSLNNGIGTSAPAIEASKSRIISDEEAMANALAAMERARQR